MRSLKALLMLGVSVSSLVQADPRDILQEFLERDAAISQRVISRAVGAGDVRGERDGLIADINGRLAGEGYQLGWTQNFGIDRELSGAAGWSISLGQGFAYDADTNVVSGKGFIAARTFDSSLFGDGPIIVGGSYSSINRESAFRLNVLQEKTFIGPVVTKGWNTQVFMVPVEGPEITVQFLNGAYQPLQVCAQILSAGILVPKEVDVDGAATGAGSKLLEEEADRKAEAARVAAEARAKAEEEAREAERQRLAAEARVKAEQEEADRKAEAARVAAEAERQRLAAEARVKAEQEEADRKAEAARVAAEAAAHAQSLLDAAADAHRERVRRVQDILDARTGAYRISAKGNIVKNTRDRHDGEVVIKVEDISSTAAEELIQRGLMT